MKIIPSPLLWCPRVQSCAPLEMGAAANLHFTPCPGFGVTVWCSTWFIIWTFMHLQRLDYHKPIFLLSCFWTGKWLNLLGGWRSRNMKPLRQQNMQSSVLFFFNRHLAFSIKYFKIFFVSFGSWKMVLHIKLWHAASKIKSVPLYLFVQTSVQVSNTEERFLHHFLSRGVIPTMQTSADGSSHRFS